ncbi:MAG: rhodanese-like domain-containing protein [Sulfurimonas sp.]|nr:MAG: rhodanese-like domain-containing protein [Sulfurimonas sp.]
MKKIILLLILLAASLLAELKNSYLTQEILNSDLPIVDVRTVGEWKNEGILKNAIPIEFYNEKGKYNINAFLTDLNAKVDTTKPFAIICRKGNRTSVIAPWLSQKHNYNVTNILGGMEYAIKELKIKVHPYKK